MAGDTRIVSGGQNSAPIVALHVRPLARANAIPVFLVNISGDAYNASGGGGVGSNVNVSQINGQTPDIGSGNAGSGTLRVIVASDQGAIPVSGNFTATTSPPPVTGVQIVGGSVGAQVSPSGDFPVRISSITVPIGITGDVSTLPKSGQIWPVKEQNVIGVMIIGGGTFGVSGDVQSKQSGAYATAITGDVLLRSNPSTNIGIVSINTPVGVQVVGGLSSRISVSGDQLAVFQQGGWAISVTGDVLLRANPSTIIGQLAGTLGVNIIGGSVGAKISASGDLNIIPSASNFNRFPTSGDTRIMDGLNNSITATVKTFARSNPIAVVLVNASGDVYNASGGGGAASNVNLNQVAGNNTSVGSGITDTGTLRVVIASDQTIPVSGTFTAITSPAPVTGVQIVGGSMGVQVSNSASGDLAVRQSSAWAVAITGDPLYLDPSRDSVNVFSGRIGVTGDVSTFQKGAWAIAITGDVLLRANPSINIGIVTVATPIGVQVLGGISSRVSVSGDQLAVFQQGAWAVAVTGDVLLRTDPNVVIGQIGGTLGVNVIGGSIGAQISASGDLAVKPQAGLTKFPTSGDSRLIDGVDPTIKATVKTFTRANPLAVTLVNASGDVVNVQPDEPTIVSVAGRFTAAGSNQLVAAVAGKRIKVFAFSLQGDSQVANARGFFASGASGSQLSIEWELAAREGVVQQIGSESAQFLFATTAGAALSMELSAAAAMKYAVSYQADDPT